jgi:starch synthase (maltosyl-transferring)
VAVAIALSANPREFWLHFGDVQIGPAGNRRPVRAIENLVSGERHLLEWNGRRLRIDPQRDPALVFRCHA